MMKRNNPHRKNRRKQNNKIKKKVKVNDNEKFEPNDISRYFNFQLDQHEKYKKIFEYAWDWRDIDF